MIVKVKPLPSSIYNEAKRLNINKIIINNSLKAHENLPEIQFSDNTSEELLIKVRQWVKDNLSFFYYKNDVESGDEVIYDIDNGMVYCHDWFMVKKLGARKKYKLKIVER